MNAAELELRAPAHRQPFHFAAHFHYGRGPGAPVVAVLWFEGTPISGGVVDETGQVVSASVATERFASPYAGWFLWLVCEPPCPRTLIGPDQPLTDVVKAAVQLIADAPEPTFDLEQSKTLLVDFLYSREPDFLLPFPDLMDLDQLTIAPAASPGNVFAAVDFLAGDDGPIVARLWYDDALSADLGDPETLPALVANQPQALGWLFWAIDERTDAQPGATARPQVYMLGPNLGMPDALACSLALLDEWEPEAEHTLESSLHALEAMGRTELDYSLMPGPLAAEAKSLRRQRWASRSAATRR